MQNLTDHAIGNDNENVIMAPEARELFITNSMTKGHPGKILEDAATGVKYMSQGEAAKELGLGIYKIRKMIGSGELIDHGPNTGLKIA